MKAYKGFDKNLQCRGFQYEVGKTYTMPEGEDVKLCKKGFHACVNVIDCFNYYEPAKSRYCEVEIEDVSSEIDNDSKRVARTITIVRELTLDEVHDISSEQQQQQENESGGYGSSVRGGNRSSVRGGDWSSVRGGNRSSVRGGDMSSVNGGDMSSVNGGYGSSVRGGDGSSVRGGDWSSVRGGNRSSVRGGDMSSVNGGDMSSVNGGYGSSVRGGDGSSVRGGDWSSVRGGDGSRFKGGKNCVFVAEYYKDYTFVGMRVAIVDGVEFSTDKWYELDDDGNWKEAENQQD